MPTDAPIDNGSGDILSLFDVLNVFLRRPQVQIQLVVIASLIGAAALIAWLFWRVVGDRVFRWVDNRKRRRARSTWRLILSLVRAVSFPVLGLIFLESARQYFVTHGMVAGLLTNFEWVLWTVFSFQIIVTLLYAAFDPATIRKYHYRLFIPLLIVLILIEILGNLTDLSALFNTVLTNVFDNPVTLGAIFIATIGLYFWTDAAHAIEEMAHQLVTRHTNVDPGGAKAMLTLMRYILIAVGIFFVLSQLQLDSATVAAIVGGLSVGVGFGLREILSNFISGILLLFEQSLRPGDVLEMNNEIAMVEDVRMRATIVRTLNNDEVVVPNQTFFTSSFKTYTGTEKKVRVPIFLQTDCVIKPRDVISLLIETSLSHPEVLPDPKPSAFILDYGNNVASFQLNIWIDNPMRRPKVTSEVKLLAWDALADNSIALPFPEVELHFPKKVTLGIEGNAAPAVS